MPPLPGRCIPLVPPRPAGVPGPTQDNTDSGTHGHRTSLAHAVTPAGKSCTSQKLLIRTLRPKYISLLQISRNLSTKKQHKEKDVSVYKKTTLKLSIILPAFEKSCTCSGGRIQMAGGGSLAPHESGTNQGGSITKPSHVKVH